MAGKLQWALEISGVDRAAKQLNDLDKAASSVGKKGIKSSDIIRATKGNFSDAFMAANPDFIREISTATEKGVLQGLKGASSKFSTIPFLSSFINQSLGIGAGGNSFNRKNYEAFWKNAQLPNNNTGLTFNPRMNGLSYMASGSGGGGNNFIHTNPIPGSGGSFGGGGILMFFLKLVKAVALAIGIFKILKFVTGQLVESIQQGSKLYQSSARIGTSASRLGVLQGGLSAIGIDIDAAQRALLYGEFGRFTRSGSQNGGRRAVDVAGQLMASGHGIFQTGDIQQIQNMAKYLNQFISESELAGRIFQDTSKQLFETNFAFSGVKREWHTLWTELATVISVVLKPAINALKWSLHGLALFIEQSPMYRLAKLLIPKDDGFNQQFGGGGGFRSLPVSQFQRMGFGMGIPTSTNDYARRTAMGIEKLVYLGGELLKYDKSGSSTGIGNNP